MRYRRTLLFVAVLSLCWTRAGYAPVGCGTPNTDAFGNQINASPNPITFILEVGASASQLLTLREIGGASADNWNAIPVVSSNIVWLSVSRVAGTCTTSGCDSTQVRADASNLTPGTYNGSILIRPSTFCGATNKTTLGNTLVVPVRLTLTAPPTSISLSPTSLTFTAQQGGPNPPSQTVTISNPGVGTLRWTATASTSFGGNWLSVSPSSGTDAGTFTVSVNIAGLTARNYTGAIRVEAPDAANTPRTINVTLTVTEPAPTPTIALSATSLTFAGQQGGANPASQTVLVSNSGAGTFPWTATVTAGPWLSVTPASGSGSGTLTVSANIAGLAAGAYNGAIQIAVPGATNTPQTVNVTLRLTAREGLPEPTLNITLPPGFYIAEVRTASGEREGYWGMEVLVQRGILSGGFNLGGGIQENGVTAAFGAFFVPGTQTVLIRLEAQILPGGDPSRFSIGVRLLNSARQQLGTEQLGTSFVQFERPLTEGFYIIEVRTAPNASRATFQLGLSADAFAGGVNVGGFVAPGLVGFGAFFVPEAQEVRIKTQGQPTFGAVGAGNLQLTLRDAARNVIRTVP